MRQGERGARLPLLALQLIVWLLKEAPEILNELSWRLSANVHNIMLLHKDFRATNDGLPASHDGLPVLLVKEMIETVACQLLHADFATCASRQAAAPASGSSPSMATVLQISSAVRPSVYEHVAELVQLVCLLACRIVSNIGTLLEAISTWAGAVNEPEAARHILSKFSAVLMPHLLEMVEDERNPPALVPTLKQPIIAVLAMTRRCGIVDKRIVPWLLTAMKSSRTDLKERALEVWGGPTTQGACFAKESVEALGLSDERLQLLHDVWESQGPGKVALPQGVVFSPLGESFSSSRLTVGEHHQELRPSKKLRTANQAERDADRTANRLYGNGESQVRSPLLRSPFCC
jgi:hypothetical protein